MILVLIVVFFALLFLAVPVGHVLVIASGAAVASNGVLPLMIVAQQMFQQTQSFPMLALPFFILAGSLMMSGKLGQNLIDFATALVQRFRGGLASVTVVGSAVFGGVSGSAVADSTALGSMLIPWQKREGYPAGFVAANNSAAATIAILIPPSIPLILILLRFGIATPTEVSVLAVFYSLIAGVVLYRDMTWRRFADAVIAAGVATGVVMLVIMASAAVGWIMTFVQAPQLFAQWASETLQAPWLIILAMIGIMLVTGMFIDLPAAILLLGPIFVPLAQSIGLDLLQLGIMMVLTLALGLYTPPVGTTLFISSSIAGVSIIQTTRELWPFYMAALTVVCLFAFVPGLTLG